MFKQKTSRQLSLFLIASGLVLLTSGLITQLQQRPNADELAALARGQRATADITLRPDSGEDMFLPVPGAESVRTSPSAAEAFPIENETPSSRDWIPPVTDPVVSTSAGIAESSQASPPPARPVIPGLPTRLVIPKINVDTKVVQVGWTQVRQGRQLVSVWEVPDYAAGFLKTSAVPGTGGNTVLEGHHNIKGEVFRYVVNLEPGDQIELYAGDQTHRYQVTEKLILKEAGASLEQRRKNAQWIAATDDERLTLVTCWPYWTNTHRVIVVARPISIDGTSGQAAPSPAS